MFLISSPRTWHPCALSGASELTPSLQTNHATCCAHPSRHTRATEEGKPSRIIERYIVGFLAASTIGPEKVRRSPSFPPHRLACPLQGQSQRQEHFGLTCLCPPVPGIPCQRYVFSGSAKLDSCLRQPSSRQGGPNGPPVLVLTSDSKL